VLKGTYIIGKAMVTQVPRTMGSQSGVGPAIRAAQQDGVQVRELQVRVGRVLRGPQDGRSTLGSCLLHTLLLLIQYL